MCLICSTKIVGLINYVDHYKSHVLQDSSQAGSQKIPEWQIKNEQSAFGSKNQIDSKHHSHQDGKYFVTSSGDTSPLSEFIDNADDFTDPDLDADSLMNQKHCPDFFQSLELKSATDEAPPPKAKIKAVQRLSVLDDDLHAESLLPITSILSNLDFSSDEEFVPISDNEDQGSHGSDDGFWLMTDQFNHSSSHPPQGHTGGKWNPGEGPKRRLPIAGKWKPGCGPGPACRKNILRKPFKFKKSKNRTGKSFYCNVCNSSFKDRTTYSMHFSQQQHSQLVEAKRQQKNGIDFLEEPEKSGQDSKVSTSTSNQTSELVVVKTRNVQDSCYCISCDLYFDSASVLSVHCETKHHKDKIQRKEFLDQIQRSSIGNDVASSSTQAVEGNTATSATQPSEGNSETTQALVPFSQGDSWSSDVISQVSKSTEPETHSCHICHKTFTRKYEMARHLLTRMHKSRAQEHPEAQSIDMLNKYNKYMTRLSLYQCGICQYYCNRQADFLDHMGSVNHVMTCQDMLGPIMCVACKFKTHKEDQMMEHLQQPEHLVALEKKHGMCIIRESHSRITCKFCGVKMHSAVRMLRHCQRKHKDRLTECQMLMFVKQVEYSLHKCPLCEKSFRAKSMLQLHFLKIHKNKSVFSCTVCDRGYLDQRRLDNHLRTRFHAKRVIASKLKEGESQGTASHELPVLHKARKKRVVKKEADIGQCVDSKKTTQDNIQGTVKEPPAALALRRSCRKRKKIEFYAMDDSDQDEKKLKKTSASVKPLKLKQLKRSALEEKEESEHSSVSAVEDVPSNKRVKRRQTRPKEDSAKNLTGQVAEAACSNFSAETTKSEEADAEEDAVDEETLNEASKHIFSCAYCEFAAVDMMELREHYNQTHPNDILTCQPCNQYFLSLKAYKIHCSGRGHQLKLKEHAGETKMHKCPVCDKRFLQESCCLLHLETVHRHPSSEADLQRIIKGHDLVTQLYGDHVKQVESLSNDSSVSCPECGKFVRKDTLVEHLRLHTGERPYICRFCSKGFAGRLTLRRHISSHLNMPMFMCDTCGREFKRNSHLIKHLRQHVSEKKGEKHTCDVCQAWFFTPEELSRHMKRHGDRNYKCTWPGCQWTFVLSSELKSHMFTHTGEKKYLCDICGFGAPTKTRLRRHEKIHDKSRTFNCDYCLYKASCKTHLKRHMRIHINSRPFACPYCNYTCNTHENIRKHILKTKKHKGKKLYPCKLCGSFGCDSSKDFRAHLMTVHEDYLKANAIDSLAVFSGLYKREEDYQKPKEGSEILPVTKGRFFRSYQNPDAPMEPPKPKKPKKISLKQRMEEVTVRIVPPSELEDVRRNDKEEEQEAAVHFKEEKSTLPWKSDPIIAKKPSDEEDSQNELEDGEAEDEESPNSGVDSPQYINVTNMVIPPYNQQEPQQLSAATISFASAHQLPVTVSVPEDKLYWTMVSEQKAPHTPEPWYSGMPQVHTPSSQELQQYRPMEVATSHPGAFLPNYYCNIPVNEIHSLQGTVGGQIYAGNLENLVVIDLNRSETATL
ncbi:zinc finger protein 91 [Biomphalaria pfeifferi]|uniref:Zinc finger protein 91 n=1 Tax=Biomphalaria pfeifferi TaxID=112525 RepID=A0AAD8EZ34_BIOPF|nr:zinc finger protein 91 [Biomphalaria pfeifferi]